MATPRVTSKKTSNEKHWRAAQAASTGNYLIPGYAAIAAWNLVAGCSALIHYAGKYALDVGDLVQRLGQRGWLQPSVFLLLPAPLQSAQEVVASCWPISLQVTLALISSVRSDRKKLPHSFDALCSTTTLQIARSKLTRRWICNRTQIVPLTASCTASISTRAHAVACKGCNTCCCACYVVVHAVLKGTI